MKIRIIDTRITDNFESQARNMNKLVVSYKGDLKGFIEKLKGWEKVLLNLLPENQKDWYKPTANPINEEGQIDYRSVLSDLDTNIIKKKFEQLKAGKVEETFNELVRKYEKELKQQARSIIEKLKNAKDPESLKITKMNGDVKIRTEYDRFEERVLTYMRMSGMRESSWFTSGTFSTKIKSIHNELNSVYKMKIDQFNKEIKTDYASQAWVKQVVAILNNFKAKCKSYNLPVDIEGNPKEGWKIKIENIKESTKGELTTTYVVAKDLMNKLEAEINKAMSYLNRSEPTWYSSGPKNGAQRMRVSTRYTQATLTMDIELEYRNRLAVQLVK